MAKLRSIIRTIALTGGTAAIVAPPSEKRRALLFVGHSTFDYTLHFNATVSATLGLSVYSKGTALELLREYHGDAVTQSWYAFSTETITINFLETVEE